MGNEKILKKILDGRRKYLSRIQGCLVGGAAGDALGYAVEFSHYRDIRLVYGPNGITAYELQNGKARFSDDTQMTLFTANGLLYGETCMLLSGSGSSPHTYIASAYRDWLYTQDHSCKPEYITSWITDIPELNCRRAPGGTCISALQSGKAGSIKSPLNDSCGCGGVMRTAPVGLFYGQYYDQLSNENIVRYGAETAAITHGHPLGYIPAGMLSLIIKNAAFTEHPLSEIITESFQEMKTVFGHLECWKEFEAVIQKALDLVSNNNNDFENIHRIGEGWVGHEALAVALYSVLRHEHDFSAALVAAVNHDGDSDSTGSICGNILGAYLGMEGIREDWTDKLELLDVIKELSVDLCDHCQMDRSGTYHDPVWTRKYVGINGINEKSIN